MLEWAFGTEYASLTLPVDHEHVGFGFGMEYVLLERAKLGGAVDGSGGGAYSSSHEDAEVIAAIVSSLDKPLAIQVAEVARSGLEPDWMPGQTPKMEPRNWTSKRGQWIGKSEACGTYIETVKIRHPKNRRRVLKLKKKHEIRWTPCTWILHPDTLRAARVDYQQWVRSLGRIRDELKRTVLTDHVVTDRLPSFRPWLK